MFPIPIIVWTTYTAYSQGRVWKRTLCENCSTDYIYALEREAIGKATETSFSPTSLFSDSPETRDNAETAANDTLLQYLENDFDPVPCPACGHYQGFMFAKLYEEGFWLPVLRVATMALSSLAGCGVLYWAYRLAQQANKQVAINISIAAGVSIVFGLFSALLGAREMRRAQAFNPNLESQELRVAKGRARAVTLAEFETAQKANSTK